MSQIVFSLNALDYGTRYYRVASLIEPLFTGSGLFGSGSNQIMSDSSFNFGIYKGLPPTQAEIDAASSTLAANFRPSDLLIRYSTNFSSAYGQIPAMRSMAESKVGAGAWLYFPPLAIALASGEATWFAFRSNPCSMLLMGTISAEGGAGDLRLVDTAIVQNEAYSLPPWIFSIPATLEV